MFLLVCKSDTTLGVSVGAHTEVSEELWEDKVAVEMLARDGIAWYAEQAGAQPVGPIRWSLHEGHALGGTVKIEEGVWGAHGQ